MGKPVYWNLRNFKTIIFVFAARVHSYDIYQGGEYAGITWKDTKYTRSEDKNGLLTGATGCLTEESHRTNPFIKPQCWIGWNKEIISNPSVTLLLSKKTFVAGLHFHIYINESMGAYTISEMTISAEDVVKGKACVSESYYNISAQGKDLKLSFQDINAQKLTIDFKYGGNWILIRSLKVLLEGLLKNVLSLSIGSRWTRNQTNVRGLWHNIFSANFEVEIIAGNFTYCVADSPQTETNRRYTMKSKMCSEYLPIWCTR